MRFRPEQHLRRQSEIRAIREEGRRIDCRAFTVWWKTRGGPAAAGTFRPPSGPPAPPLHLPRVCVIASTAAVGHAVRRNRAKRRLREVFRHRQHELPIDCDLLLIARGAAATWPLGELEKKFTEACRQIAPTGLATGEK